MFIKGKSAKWSTLNKGVSSVYLAFCLILLIGSFQDISTHLKSQSLFISVQNNHLTFSDFVIFYLGGKMAFSADAHHIYDPAVQLKWFNSMLGSIKLNKPFYSQNVPFAFTLMGPLSLLPIDQAYVLWCIVSVVFGLGLMALFLNSFGSAPIKTQIAMLLAISASFPAIVNLRMGQQCFLLLGLEVLYLFGLFRNKDVLSGCALAGLSIKPHYCLFLSVPALVLRRWRLLNAAVIAEAVLLGLAAFTVGYKNVLSYPAILLHADSTPDYLGVNPQKMVSIRGVVSLLLPHEASLPVSLIIMVAGIMFNIWIWTAAKGCGTKDFRLPACLTILTCLIVSPHTHLYDLLMLAPLAVTLTTGSLLELLALKPLCFRLWSMILYAYPPVSWLLLVLYSIAVPVPFLCLFALNLALLFFGVLSFKAAIAGNLGVNA